MRDEKGEKLEAVSLSRPPILVQAIAVSLSPFFILLKPHLAALILCNQHFRGKVPHLALSARPT